MKVLKNNAMNEADIYQKVSNEPE